MQTLDTEIRITKAGKLQLLPANFRFIADESQVLHLADATITIDGHALSWSAKVGHIFSTTDRAAFDQNPAFTLVLADAEATWKAKRVTRTDGMETVMLEGGIDLAEVSFRELLTARQVEAVELLAEAIGRPVPSIL